MKPLLSIFGLLATLTPIKTDSPKEREVNVGSEVQIACELKGPKVTWYWLPHYPICLGKKGDKKEIEIFLVISNGIKMDENSRFHGRLISNSTKEKLTTITLKHLYMNDSGVFYCSNGSKESTRISVTVKPGYQNGITRDYSEEKKSSIITITCNECKNKMEKGVNEGDTIIRWTLNGNPFSKERISSGTRNSLRLNKPFGRYFGLWKCARPRCLTEFDGYCLENDSKTSKNFGDVETSTVSPKAQDGKTLLPYVIGGCIAGVLILFLICVVIFIICRRSRSHSVSEITRKPEKQECKEETSSEGPPKRREEEEPRTSEDYTSREGAVEGLQYSTLEFKEAGQQQIKISNEISSVIYAQMPTGH